jgi:hypothetical protein
LLGNIAAHALAKSTGGEDCREAPFEGFRSAFRVRNIACHAKKCRKNGIFVMDPLPKHLILSKYENMNMCSYIKTAKNVVPTVEKAPVSAMVYEPFAR